MSVLIARISASLRVRSLQAQTVQRAQLNWGASRGEGKLPSQNNRAVKFARTEKWDIRGRPTHKNDQFGETNVFSMSEPPGRATCCHFQGQG